MLIKREILDAIKSGNITLQFRRWSRASVKSGGTLKTVVGILNIGAITELSEDQVELADVKRAGFEDIADFKRWLDTMKPGYLCKIELSYGGEDPMIAYRNQSELSVAEISEIETKLAALEKRAPSPWTRDHLTLIGENAGATPQELAEKTGFELAKFKTQLSKLKALGLVVIESKTAALSPRAIAYLSA